MLSDAGADVVHVDRPGGRDAGSPAGRVPQPRQAAADARPEGERRPDDRPRPRRPSRRGGRELPPRRDGAARPGPRRAAGRQPPAGALLPAGLRLLGPRRRGARLGGHGAGEGGRLPPAARALGPHRPHQGHRHRPGRPDLHARAHGLELLRPAGRALRRHGPHRPGAHRARPAGGGADGRGGGRGLQHDDQPPGLRGAGGGAEPHAAVPLPHHVRRPPARRLAVPEVRDPPAGGRGRGRGVGAAGADRPRRPDVRPGTARRDRRPVRGRGPEPQRGVVGRAGGPGQPPVRAGAHAGGVDAHAARLGLGLGRRRRGPGSRADPAARLGLRPGVRARRARRPSPARPGPRRGAGRAGFAGCGHRGRRGRPPPDRSARRWRGRSTGTGRSTSPRRWPARPPPGCWPTSAPR